MSINKSNGKHMLQVFYYSDINDGTVKTLCLR